MLAEVKGVSKVGNRHRIYTRPLIQVEIQIKYIRIRVNRVVIRISQLIQVVQIGSEAI